MRIRDVEHLFRLATVFAVALLLFVVVRAVAVPDDFGRYGFYRGNALDEARAKPIVHAGQRVCAECHEDVVKLRAEARHANVSCESCHGPLASHAAAPDAVKVTKPDGRLLCARCHAAKTGKPVRYPRVDIKEHAGDESCLTCHKPHDPRVN